MRSRDQTALVFAEQVRPWPIDQGIPGQGNDMKHVWKKGVVIACALSVSACASIVGGRYEKVQVQARNDDQSVHANCIVSNGVSQVSVTTPATARVHRSSYDLNVVCLKDGREVAQQTFDSGIHGIVWGNILLGGALGIGIDFYNGAARDYPDQVTMQLASPTGSSYPNVNANVDQGGSGAPLSAEVASLASLDSRVSKSVFNAAQNTAAAHQCNRAIHVVKVDGSHATFRSQCQSANDVQIECNGDACVTTQPSSLVSR